MMTLLAYAATFILGGVFAVGALMALVTAGDKDLVSREQRLSLREIDVERRERRIIDGALP